MSSDTIPRHPSLSARAWLRPLARRPWFPALVAGTLATLLMGGQVIFDPAHVQLGSAETEAPGHLWGLWTVASGLFHHGPFVRVAAVSWPASFAAHLMDPINLLLFLPFYWLGGGGAIGASLGWNALHVGGVAIGAFGCWKLGRRIFGDHPQARWAVALLTLVFCASPYFLFVPYMGRTEYLPALLCPGHLALLHRWMRRPVGFGATKPKLEDPPPNWVGVCAGLTLGAVALGGWYLAVFVALLEIPVALWWSLGLTPRDAAHRLGLVAGLALVCLAPALWAVLAYPPDQGSLLSAQNIAIRVDQFPVDPLPALFRISQSGQGDRWMDEPGYVGVVSMVLGALGALRYRGRARGWMIIAIWMLLLAAGPFLAWSTQQATANAGQDLWPMPLYGLLTVFPPLRAMRNWSRIGVLAPLPMGVAAAFGLLALTEWYRKWRRGLIAVVLALVMADQLTYPNVYSPVRPTFRSAMPAPAKVALTHIPSGALLEFPIDIPLRMLPGPEARGMYLLWQLQQARPVSASPSTGFDAALAFSTLARQAADLQTLGVVARGGSLDPAARPSRALPQVGIVQIACAQADIPLLRKLGFTGAVLYTDRAGASDLEPLLTSVLGAPVYRKLPVVAWDLTVFPAAKSVDASAGRCTLPRLPRRISQQVGTMSRIVWQEIQEREESGT